jgi:hypothetical protein
VYKSQLYIYIANSNIQLISAKFSGVTGYFVIKVFEAQRKLQKFMLRGFESRLRFTLCNCLVRTSLKMMFNFHLIILFFWFGFNLKIRSAVAGFFFVAEVRFPEEDEIVAAARGNLSAIYKIKIEFQSFEQIIKSCIIISKFWEFAHIQNASIKSAWTKKICIWQF